ANPTPDPITGVNLNWVVFQPSGEQAVQEYSDGFINFVEQRLLHVVQFRDPAFDPATGIVQTMKVFVDAEDGLNGPIPPVFEHAPGESGFQPLAEVITFTRAVGVAPGAVTSAADMTNPALVAQTVSQQVVTHAGFVVANGDPNDTSSVFFP